MDHVAGYCVLNDVSERAFQMDRYRAEAAALSEGG